MKKNKYYTMGKNDMRKEITVETMSVTRMQTIADYLSVEMTGRSVSQRRQYLADYIAGCRHALAQITDEIQNDLSRLLSQFNEDQIERMDSKAR